jgi:osmoprotectant transport system substrate-binding protein
VAGKPVIRIASFDFPESVLLAQIYGQALEAHDFPVRLSLELGSREVVQPALQQGFVDLVPEYAGSALEFVTVGRDQPTADPGATHDLLVRALRPKGVAVLDAAPAQDQNAIVVTADTARANGLRTVSDLDSLASGLVFGGPPECPVRTFCLPGLKSTYGLSFEQFMSLDASGPYTVNALKDGAVDVALLFTTDGDISPNGFVVLQDDRDLQPAENVTPVLRRAVVAAYGDRVVEVLDAVSAQLTTSDLADMNQHVSLDGRSPADVARAWLEEHGLVG